MVRLAIEKLLHPRFVGLALLALGLFAPALAVAGTGLHFDREYLSLGRVEVSGDLTERFPFQVKGDAPVQILDLKSSCGCISPDLSKRAYLPGEKGELIFGIHAASQTEGKRRFQVSVTYQQAGEITTVPLIVDAELYKPIAIEPSTLLAHVSGQRPVTQILTVRDQRKRPLGGIQLGSSSKLIQAKLLAPTPGDATARRIEVTLAEHFPLGKTDERLVVRLSGETPTEIVVPVTVVRSSRIKVLPETLHASRGSGGGKSPSWLVLVRDARGEPVRIHRVDFDRNQLDVQYPTDATGSCRLQVKATGVGGAFESVLTLHIAEPVVTEIKLPVRVD